MKSVDGGKTFRPVRGLPHGDSHDMWIDPKNSNRMIEGDDGGGTVSIDGGRTWSDEDFATAQFYHVVATTHFPYRVCGAQQDNSTLCGPSRGSLDISDWLEAGGGESGFIAPRYDNPDIVYAGSYGNLLTRKDMQTGISVNVNPWPDNPMGHPAIDLKYRFQWTFPIIVSKHNSNVVYAGSQHVHKTMNGGKSWTVISPDLTYHDPATLGNSGGPLTKDQTSVEYYATVFAIEESPITPKTIWTGSDDGKVFVTRDGGVKWTDVTPKDMVKFTRVSSIDASKFGECIAYVAANRFQLDDEKPYLWKTSDCGASWTRIDNGIPNGEFTRVLREDPGKRGLLVAGTERGVYYSADDGAHWQSLRLGLPFVPIHDLTFKQGDLIIATHGRSFYIMDDISTLEQMTDAIAEKPAHLFKPRDQYRLATGGGGGGGGGRGGRSAAGGDAGERGRASDRRESTDRCDRAVLAQDGRRNRRPRFPRRRRQRQFAAYSSKVDSAATPAPAAGGDERLRSAAPGAARPEPRGVNTFQWNSATPTPRLSRNDSLGGRCHWSARSTGHVQSANDGRRHTDRHGDVQGAARSARQGDARRVAGTVARRAADSRPVLRSQRRREGDSPPEGRACGSSGKNAGSREERVRRAVGKVRDGSV